MRDRPIWKCDMCSMDAHGYVVWNRVWNIEAGLPSKAGLLCIDCLEGLIARRLEAVDFAPLPLTTENIFGPVAERITDKLLIAYDDDTSNVDEPIYMVSHGNMRALYRKPVLDFYLYGLMNGCPIDQRVINPSNGNEYREAVVMNLDFPIEALPADPSEPIYDYEVDKAR